MRTVCWGCVAGVALVLASITLAQPGGPGGFYPPQLPNGGPTTSERPDPLAARMAMMPGHNEARMEYARLAASKGQANAAKNRVKPGLWERIKRALPSWTKSDKPAFDPRTGVDVRQERMISPTERYQRIREANPKLSPAEARKLLQDELEALKDAKNAPRPKN